VNPEAAPDSLPLLAIVYGSLSLEQPLRRLAEAAHGACRILWVLPFDRKDSRTAARMMKARGEIDGDIIDASKLTTDEAAETIRAYHPQGITCFIDETIVWTAEVAERLGLTFHSPHTAECLTDKLKQRIALAEYGLQTPPFWNPDDLEIGNDIAEVVRSAGLPLVFKPRRGTSSKDTAPLQSVADLEQAITTHEHGRMLIEGYIPEPTQPCTGTGSAPYVSVEVLVADGVTSVLGVTGRMPLAEPFRETGQYFPANMTADAMASAAEVATKAGQALGITSGVLHVEVKCTDAGPVVIEVNGRPGGGSTSDFLVRAYDLDLVRLTMRVALGERLTYTDLPEPDNVLFRLDVQPDARLTRITAIEGIDAVRRIPGVEQVTQGMAAGDALSWRDGTFSRVAVVTGAAPDHETAQKIRAQVLSTIRIEGDETG